MTTASIALHSMTGFASASRDLGTLHLNLELRAVNHRYLDLQFKLPEELRHILSSDGVNEKALQQELVGARRQAAIAEARLKKYGSREAVADLLKRLKNYSWEELILAGVRGYGSGLFRHYLPVAKENDFRSVHPGDFPGKFP